MNLDIEIGYEECEYEFEILDITNDLLHNNIISIINNLIIIIVFYIPYEVEKDK